MESANKSRTRELMMKPELRIGAELRLKVNERVKRQVVDRVCGIVVVRWSHRLVLRNHANAIKVCIESEEFWRQNDLVPYNGRFLRHRP